MPWSGIAAGPTLRFVDPTMCLGKCVQDGGRLLRTRRRQIRHEIAGLPREMEVFAKNPDS
jgi:hypothetical protein